MEQLPGFVIQGECAQKVCRLKKSLHGLKQSPRARFRCFASVIQEFGFCRAEKDHSVFWRIQHGKRITLVVYVDVIVITGDDTKGIDSLKKYLQKHSDQRSWMPEVLLRH